MSRSQTLKAFDRFINDGTLPTKQEVKQDQDHQVASALAIEEKCCVCLELLTSANSFTFPCCHRCVHTNCLSDKIENCPICRMKRGIHEAIPPSSEEQILFREQREK